MQLSQSTVQSCAPFLIASGSTGVLIFVVDTMVVYMSTGFVCLAAIVYCVRTIRRCNARMKRLELLKTRKSRREHGITCGDSDRNGVPSTPEESR